MGRLLISDHFSCVPVPDFNPDKCLNILPSDRDSRVRTEPFSAIFYHNYLSVPDLLSVTGSTRSSQVPSTGFPEFRVSLFLPHCRQNCFSVPSVLLRMSFFYVHSPQVRDPTRNVPLNCSIDVSHSVSPGFQCRSRSLFSLYDVTGSYTRHQRSQRGRLPVLDKPKGVIRVNSLLITFHPQSGPERRVGELSEFMVISTGVGTTGWETLNGNVRSRWESSTPGQET